MCLVFVYGSLKRGYPNHRLLGEALFLGPHVTKDCYTMTDLGYYPAVSLHGTTSIHGEVYEVTTDELATLDVLEGVPDYYHRILIPTSYGEAWMYFMPISQNPVHRLPLPSAVASGDW